MAGGEAYKTIQAALQGPTVSATPEQLGAINSLVRTAQEVEDAQSARDHEIALAKLKADEAREIRETEASDHKLLRRSIERACYIGFGVAIVLLLALYNSSSTDAELKKKIGENGLDLLKLAIGALIGYFLPKKKGGE